MPPRAEGQQLLLGRVEPRRQQGGPALEPAGAGEQRKQAIAQPPCRRPAEGGQVALPTRTDLDQAGEPAADALIAASQRRKVAAAAAVKARDYEIENIGPQWEELFESLYAARNGRG